MAQNPTAPTTAPTQRKAAPAPILQANLSRTKETKGAWRYDTPQNETDRIGGALNIYLRKDSLKGEPPQNVQLTITAI